MLRVHRVVLIDVVDYQVLIVVVSVCFYFNVNRYLFLLLFSRLVNLSMVGQDDSSSEEAPINVPNQKPAIPPRPRSISVDHKRFGNVTNNGGIIKNNRGSNFDLSQMDVPCKDTDVASADCNYSLRAFF